MSLPLSQCKKGDKGIQIKYDEPFLCPGIDRSGAYSFFPVCLSAKKKKLEHSL